jgi:hypothetical protein
MRDALRWLFKTFSSHLFICWDRHRKHCGLILGWRERGEKHGIRVAISVSILSCSPRYRAGSICYVSIDLCSGGPQQVLPNTSKHFLRMFGAFVDH